MPTVLVGEITGVFWVIITKTLRIVYSGGKKTMTVHLLKLTSSLGSLKTSEERKKLILSLDSMSH